MADIVKPTPGASGWNTAVDATIDAVNVLVPAVAGKAPTVHGHTAASITDLTEAVQDIVGGLLGAGSNVVVNYDDAANSLTISATGSGGTGLDAEAVRDAIGVALVGVGNIAVTVNDAADTITISTTATANSTDAALRDRGTHTGTQSADSVDETTGRKWLTAAERTKLTGVATGATAYTDEQAQDAVAAMVAAGTHSGVSFTYNDAAGSLSATVSGGGSTDPEVVRDTIAAALIAGSNVTVTANDAADTITVAVTGLTRLTVDGAYQPTYDLDTSPVAPGELSPPAYTQDQVDDLIASAPGAGGGGAGPWVPVQDNGIETNFTTTAWTPIAGLAVAITVGSTSEVYRVDALLDLASYAANTATMIVNLSIDGNGHSITYPLKYPVNGFRDSVPCSWILSGLSVGSHNLGLACYMTATGNYQSGTGTTLIVERKA